MKTRRSSSCGAELAELPSSAKLCEVPPFEVYAARAALIPRVLRAIGRARATVFPEAARGGIELDAYDATYLHLFVWNRDEHELVGAYRVAATDELGPSKLYTHSLFDYDARLLEAIGPALELGRSFVVPAYQKSHGALDLLWKGIGRLLARSPRHRALLGAVTLPHDLAPEARELLLRFLETRAVPESLQGLARARRPVRERPEVATPTDLADLGRRFAERAGERHGIPPLVKHYARIGARVFDFSVDPGFGGSVDALILVDLRRVPEPILARYLGAEVGARAAKHRILDNALPSELVA